MTTKDMTLLAEVMGLLADSKSLPHRNKDHLLSGDFTSCQECHITSD